MIDFYTWTTPNGRKVSIMLEETGLPYRVIPVDISNGEQFSADFLKISPNNKIPAIVDQEENIALMESGAILIYLAEKTGQFLPGQGESRARTLEWLMLQMGGVGPMLGQVHHFVKYHPEASAYATERFGKEAVRLYGVLDNRLGKTQYLAGSDYSIADIATWPWISRFEWQQIDLASFPNVCRWYRDMAERPAVQRGYVVPHKVTDIPMP
jgi:GST-like protein